MAYVNKSMQADTRIMTFVVQSFANIARATPDQLRTLPGFGQVKVKNIGNAFEKPFRNQATSSIAASLSQKQVVRPRPTASTSKAGQQAPTTRSRSPEWDIEFDDAALPNEDEEIVVMEKESPRIFDVDLDLT